ncbi:MAG TPA: beta-galactosidase [Kiritimatiellia bacterium]|nr:beta-galactosidase [Kiritimatiellia bacterium]HPS07737.1 beta-galactosidase [Kiritimatiellia bacterium]
MRGWTVLCAVLIAWMAVAENLLENPSFEKADGERIPGWDWQGGAAMATCQANPAIARSGKSSLCLKNPTPQQPNVFGSLTQTVGVSPNSRYTLSCYVKTDGGGVAWIGGGRRWQHRFMLPAKTAGWQRVVGSFATEAGETQFTLRINTDSATAGLWIDDVMLEPGAAATPFVHEAPLADGESRLTLQPFEPGANLVPNSSFEEIENGCPAGWHWDRRNTDAKLMLDATGPHTGKTAVKITNGTAFGAHVYGTLWLARPVPVKPGTSYTLSAFVKTGKTSPGIWIGGGEGWKVRRSLPATRGRWERVAHTFVTGEKETEFVLRICSDRPTEGVWLDDLSLREGVSPVPAALEGAALADFVDLAPAEPPEVLYKGHAINTRWAPQRWPNDAWSFCGNEFKADGVVTVGDASHACAVEVELADAAGRVLTRQQAALAAGTRAALLTLRAELGGRAPETLALTARLLRDGRPAACHTGTVNLVSSERVRARLAPAVAARERLRADVEQLEKRGLGAASRVTLTVLDNFVPWVASDLADGKVDRAWDTACLLDQMSAREEAHARAILDGQAADFPVPRYATGKLEISHAQTVGTRRFPDGTTERGPVLFTGYGHFGQVKRDIEKLPGYGCNIIQIEFGPNSVLPNETDTSDRAIQEFLAVCDRAAQANVSVILLLSPHYFPQWALEKWPHLKACEGGFFKYCVHDPDARAVIEKSLRQVIPRVKDHPALHSICLSNEPICVDLSKCRVTAQAWPAWLEKRHGSIATLNARWGTAYADFASIPVPQPEFTDTPACLDFIRFNNETFAAFHRWMADVVHDMAPGLPVHAKIMMGAHFQKTLHGFWSVDPGAFAALSQYNGNDAYNMYDKDGSLWINGWRHCQAGYDFQRSMADLSVVNSENHLIVDRDLDVIPPAHIYAALWQNAVHGQSATTIWLWERSNDYASDASGSILHRPDCVEAVGRCGLDLNRLAREVAAIQNLAPSIVFLWSPSSVMLGKNHEHALTDAYEAANFLGQPLGFATEEKLALLARTGVAPRPLDSAKVLMLPSVTHLPDDARAGLEKLRTAGVRAVVVGEAPAENDYNQPRDAAGFETLLKSADSAALFESLAARAEAWGLPPALRVVDTQGRPVFGVEIRAARLGDGRVASVCNHLREPKVVTLAGVTDAPMTDLITGKRLEPTFTVEPMVPLLLQMRAAGNTQR